MELVDGAAVIPFVATMPGAGRPTTTNLDARGHGRLICPREDGLGSAFHVWVGGSGRRHVMSVYPVDRDADDLGLPDYTRFVLLLVRARGETRRTLDIVSVEHASDRRRVCGEARAGAADQWHVYLLGDTREARAAIVDDLASRHDGSRVALSA